MANIPEISVDIVARLDKLESGMRQAEGIAKTGADRIEKATKIENPFGGLATAGIKVFASMNAIEAAAKGMRGAIQGVKGDFDGLEKTIRSLPFGVGQAIGSLADLTAEILGVSEAMEEQNRIAEIGARVNQFQDDRAKALVVSLNEQASAIERVRDEIGLLQAATPEQRLDVEEFIRQRAATERGEATGIDPTAEHDAIEQLFDLRRRRAAEELDRRIEAELESFFRFQDTAADETFKNQIGIAQEIFSANMELMGREFDARDQQIRYEFALRRELASNETERSLLERLEAIRIEQNEMDRAEKERLDRDRKAAEDRSILERFLADNEPKFTTPQLGQEIQVGRTNFGAFRTPAREENPLVPIARQHLESLKAIERNTRAGQVPQILGVDR